MVWGDLELKFSALFQVQTFVLEFLKIFLKAIVTLQLAEEGNYFLKRQSGYNHRPTIKVKKMTLMTRLYFNNPNHKES